MHKITYEGDSKVIKRLCEMVNELIDRGAGTVEDLTDVDLTDLTDGQILKYDSLNEQWINADDAGGTEVIANPTGTPTEDLTSIQIDGDIYRIVGGGGGGSYDVELLYNQVVSTTGQITLSDDITNYDEIMVVGSYPDGYRPLFPSITPVDFLINECPYVANPTYYTPHIIMPLNSSASQWVRYMMGDANNKLYIWLEGGTVTFKIYGIKNGGGGGSGYTETDLWAGTGNMYNSLSLVLDDDYTNYDALRFEYEAVRNDAQNAPIHYEKTVSQETLSTSDRFSISDFYMWNNVGVNVSGQFTDGTHLTTYLEAMQWFASCTLTKIVGVNYGAGGGGTDVEANPSATPTDELNSIRIGNTVYEVVGGGSGGSFKDDLLWSGDTVQNVYDLDHSISDYNFIYMKAYYMDGSTHCTMSAIFLASEIMASAGESSTQFDVSDEQHYFYFYADDATHINKGSWVSGLIIEEIHGIKTGGSGGGSQEVDLIYEASDTTAVTTVTTDHAMTNYDYILVECSEVNNPYIATEFLLKNEVENAITNNDILINIFESNSYYCQYTVTNATTLTKVATSNMYVRKIYGVKAGGGTNVVANPEGEATDELTKIQIGDEIYEIVGGSGGSGYEATLIYDGSALSSLQSSIELDDRWDNYDALYLTFKFNGDGSTFGGLILKEQLLEALNHTYMAIGSYASNYVGAHIVNDYKTFNQIYGGGNQQQNIYAVYGIKFGSGGGQGGSGYDATLLWDYKTDNNNSVLYGLNSATLHDSAENYDALIIEVVSVVSDETDATWKGTCQFFVDVNALGNAFNEKYIICESVANRSCKYHIDGTTLQKTAEATANTNGLVRVYGLKYGSGGAGGASALEDLTDVDLSSLSNGQILKYNSTSQKWENSDEKKELPNVASSYSNVFLGADYSDSPQVKWVKDKTSNSYGINKLTEIQSGKWTGFSYRLSDYVYHNANDAYDSAATYNTGDYCIYLNKWYKCKADNITGSWDSTKWDEVPLSDLLPLIGGSSLPFNVVIDSNDNGINLVYDDGQ